jgi:hypothetical protein
VSTRSLRRLGLVLAGLLVWAAGAGAWNDETHLAIAKAAGYAKWYNAAGADIAKVKAGALEQHNHYANNPAGATVTAADVLAQVPRYDTVDAGGHLYGAVLAAVRAYRAERARGKYGEYHLAFAAHYLGDLSMPLHNTEYNAFNRKNHAAVDAIVDAAALGHLERIRIDPVEIRSEDDLASQVARLANSSHALGRRLEAEGRLPTPEEAYAQLGHSASILRAVLLHVGARLLPGVAGAGPPPRAQ